MNRILAIIIACVFFAAAVLLAGGIPGTFGPVGPTVTPAPTPTPSPTPTPTPPPPPAPASGIIWNTDALVVGAGQAVPFSTGVDLVNAALPVPYTLVLGPGSGGNYSVYYNVYLRNTTGATVTDTFAVCVNGVKMPETEAGVTVPSDGNWYYLSKSAEVYLPSGGMVQLVNTGVAAAECTNNQGWHSFPSVRMDITYAGD